MKIRVALWDSKSACAVSEWKEIEGKGDLASGIVSDGGVIFKNIQADNVTHMAIDVESVGFFLEPIGTFEAGYTLGLPNINTIVAVSGP